MPYSDLSKLLLWRGNNREKLKTQSRENARRYRADPICRARQLEAQHKYRAGSKYKTKYKKDTLDLKVSIFLHYSKNIIQCEICGEKRLPCLSLDHINGGGSKHKKSIGAFGSNFYSWIKKNNYPDGYRVLCMNCQWITKFEYGQVRKGKLNDIQ